MRKHRFSALGLIALLLGGLLLQHAAAHGSLQTPLSRTYGCFLEGPEQPQSAACQAAVAVGGTQALYDWNEVNIGDAAGRHRQIIPDGQLCSAGRSKYAGFDLPRADWPATSLTAGASYTFIYRATAPHRGTFELYITRNGYDPTQPLRWADLEPAPFLRSTNPPLANGAYVMAGHLPAGKTGRHLIYAIWQRSDSPEAFYACSDVLFGTSPQPTATRTPAVPATATPRPTATHTPAPTATPGQPTATRPPATATPRPTATRTPAPTATATRPPATATPGQPTATRPPATATPQPGIEPWMPYRAYAADALVSYNGLIYRCWQPHTALPGWEPPFVPALWIFVP